MRSPEGPYPAGRVSLYEGEMGGCEHRESWQLKVKVGGQKISCSRGRGGTAAATSGVLLTLPPDWDMLHFCC